MKEDSFQKFVEEARENRRKFLARFKDEFASTRDPKIIIKLIKLEPTHLEEPWVVQEVIRWIMNHRHIDFLEEAFLHQKGRDRPTERERIENVKEYFLYKEINHIMKEENLSERKACQQLANRQADNPREIFPMWNEDNPDHDLEGVVRQKYLRYKKRLEDQKLPRPYYGVDVWITEFGPP